MVQDIKERIQRNVEVDPLTNCWNWQRSLMTSNRWAKGVYGIISMPIGKRGNRKMLTHRASYEAFIGPIPKGLCVLHKCDNTTCCNPLHLFIGTRHDNMADCRSKGRNHRPVGEQNGKAKLTLQDVRIIRRMWHLYRIPYGQIVHQFGLTHGHVWGIVNGTKWKIF